MSKGIVFPLDERQPLALKEFGSFEEYQSAVGGYVEAISVGSRMAFYVHDEAKLVGLGINRRATLLWWLHTPSARDRDFIAGDAVLIGSDRRQGDGTDVPGHIAELLLDSTDFALDVRVVGERKWFRNPTDFNDYFEAVTWTLDLATHRREVEGVRIVRLS